MWCVKGGVDFNECENVLRKEEMLEEFEVDIMNFLVDMLFVIIDIKDDCGSKYFII